MNLLRTVKLSPVRTFIASLLIVCLVATASPFSGAQISEHSIAWPAELGSLSIPPELGRISDRFTGYAGKAVVFIQDAHAHYEAQKNISNILKLLSEKHRLDFVGVEGLEGLEDFSFIRSFPQAGAREKVLDQAVREGGTTGVEYFAMTEEKPIRVVGVDDEELYIRNIQQYAELVGNHKDFDRTFSEIKQAAQNLGASVYSDKLKEMNRMMEKYDRNTTDLFSLLRALRKWASGSKVSFEDLGNVTRIFGILDSKSEISDEDLKKEWQDVNVVDLWNEIETFVDRLKTQFSATAAEREILAIDEYVKLLERGRRLELNRNEVEQFSAFQNTIGGNFISTLAKLALEKRVKIPAFSETTVEEVGRIASAILEFYEVAYDRDRGFVDKLKTEMRRKNSSVAALVTGGFHGEGILKQLKKQKISYIVITPTMTEFPKENLYAKLMLDFGSVLSFPRKRESNFLDSPVKPGNDINFTARLLPMYTPLPVYQEDPSRGIDLEKMRKVWEKQRRYRDGISREMIREAGISDAEPWLRRFQQESGRDAIVLGGQKTVFAMSVPDALRAFRYLSGSKNPDDIYAVVETGNMIPLGQGFGAQVESLKNEPLRISKDRLEEIADPQALPGGLTIKDLTIAELSLLFQQSPYEAIQDAAFEELKKKADIDSIPLLGDRIEELENELRSLEQARADWIARNAIREGKAVDAFFMDTANPEAGKYRTLRDSVRRLFRKINYIRDAISEIYTRSNLAEKGFLPPPPLDRIQRFTIPARAPFSADPVFDYEHSALRILTSEKTVPDMKNFLTIGSHLYEKEGEVVEAGEAVPILMIRKFDTLEDTRTHKHYFTSVYSPDDIFAMMAGYLFFDLIGLPVRESFVMKDEHGELKIVRELIENGTRFEDYDVKYGRPLVFDEKWQRVLRASLLLDEIVGYTDRDETNLFTVITKNGEHVPLFVDMKFSLGLPKYSIPGAESGIQYDFSKYVGTGGAGKLPEGFAFNKYQSAATKEDLAWMAKRLEPITDEHIDQIVDYVSSVVKNHTFDLEKLKAEWKNSLRKAKAIYGQTGFGAGADRESLIERLQSRPSLLPLIEEKQPDILDGKPQFTEGGSVNIFIDPDEPAVFYKVFPPYEDGHLLNEAEALLDIREKNKNLAGIPQILALGEKEDGRVWLRMRGIAGARDLEFALEENWFTPAEVAEILIRVAKTLYELHLVGWRQGEAKRKNILVNRAKETLVIDFGFAGKHKEGDIDPTMEQLGVTLWILFEDLLGEHYEGSAVQVLAEKMMVNQIQGGMPAVIEELQKIKHGFEERETAGFGAASLNKERDEILGVLKAIPALGRLIDTTSLTFRDRQAMSLGSQSFIFEDQGNPEVFYKVSKNSFNTLDAVHLVLDEVKTLIAIRTANPGIKGIPEILSLGVTKNGRLWVKMKGIKEAESLTDAIQDGWITQNDLADIFIRVAEILETVHNAGWVHNDVKDANIVVNQNKEVMVIDFGIAEKEGTVSSRGTPAYTPKRDSDRRRDSDVYGLGKTILTSLALMGGQMQPDRRLIELSNRMVAEDRQHRYPKDMLGVVKELQRIQSGAGFGAIEIQHGERGEGERHFEKVLALVEGAKEGFHEQLKEAFQGGVFRGYTVLEFVDTDGDIGFYLDFENGMLVVDSKEKIATEDKWDRKDLPLLLGDKPIYKFAQPGALFSYDDVFVRVSKTERVPILKFIDQMITNTSVLSAEAKALYRNHIKSLRLVFDSMETEVALEEKDGIARSVVIEPYERRVKFEFYKGDRGLGLETETTVNIPEESQDQVRVHTHPEESLLSPIDAEDWSAKTPLGVSTKLAEDVFHTGFFFPKDNQAREAALKKWAELGDDAWYDRTIPEEYFYMRDVILREVDEENLDDEKVIQKLKWSIESFHREAHERFTKLLVAEWQSQNPEADVKKLEEQASNLFEGVVLRLTVDTGDESRFARRMSRDIAAATVASIAIDRLMVMRRLKTKTSVADALKELKKHMASEETLHETARRAAQHARQADPRLRAPESYERLMVELVNESAQDEIRMIDYLLDKIEAGERTDHEIYNWYFAARLFSSQFLLGRAKQLLRISSYEDRVKVALARFDKDVLDDVSITRPKYEPPVVAQEESAETIGDLKNRLLNALEEIKGHAENVRVVREGEPRTEAIEILYGKDADPKTIEKASLEAVGSHLIEMQRDILPPLKSQDYEARILRKAEDWVGWHLLGRIQPDEAWQRHVQNIVGLGFKNAAIILLGMMGPHLRQLSDPADYAVYPLLMSVLLPELKLAGEKYKNETDSKRKKVLKNRAELLAAVLFNALHVNPHHVFSLRIAKEMDEAGRSFNIETYDQFFQGLMDALEFQYGIDDPRKIIEETVNAFPELLLSDDGSIPLYLQFSDREPQYGEQTGQDIVKLFAEFLEKKSRGGAIKPFPSIWHLLRGSDPIVEEFLKERNHIIPKSQLDFLTAVRARLLSGRLFERQPLHEEGTKPETENLVRPRPMSKEFQNMTYELEDDNLFQASLLINEILERIKEEFRSPEQLKRRGLGDFAHFLGMKEIVSPAFREYRKAQPIIHFPVELWGAAQKRRQTSGPQGIRPPPKETSVYSAYIPGISAPALYYDPASIENLAKDKGIQLSFVDFLREYLSARFYDLDLMDEYSDATFRISQGFYFHKKIMDAEMEFLKWLGDDQIEIYEKNKEIELRDKKPYGYARRLRDPTPAELNVFEDMWAGIITKLKAMQEPAVVHDPIAELASEAGLELDEKDEFSLEEEGETNLSEFMEGLPFDAEDIGLVVRPSPVRQSGQENELWAHFDMWARFDQFRRKDLKRVYSAIVNSGVEGRMAGHLESEFKPGLMYVGKVPSGEPNKLVTAVLFATSKVGKVYHFLILYPNGDLSEFQAIKFGEWSGVRVMEPEEVEANLKKDNIGDNRAFTAVRAAMRILKNPSVPQIPPRFGLDSTAGFGSTVEPQISDFEQTLRYIGALKKTGTNPVDKMLRDRLFEILRRLPAGEFENAMSQIWKDTELTINVFHGVFGITAPTEALAKEAERYIAGGKRFLDFGSGSGFQSLRLISAAKKKNISIEITAVENAALPSVNTEFNLQKNHDGDRMKFIQGDGIQLLSKQSFDVILMKLPYWDVIPILEAARPYLSPNTAILYTGGDGHEQEIEARIREFGYEIKPAEQKSVFRISAGFGAKDELLSSPVMKGVFDFWRVFAEEKNPEKVGAALEHLTDQFQGAGLAFKRPGNLPLGAEPEFATQTIQRLFDYMEFGNLLPMNTEQALFLASYMIENTLQHPLRNEPGAAGIFAILPHGEDLYGIVLDSGSGMDVAEALKARENAKHTFHGLGLNYSYQLNTHADSDGLIASRGQAFYYHVGQGKEISALPQTPAKGVLWVVRVPFTRSGAFPAEVRMEEGNKMAFLKHPSGDLNIHPFFAAGQTQTAQEDWPVDRAAFTAKNFGQIMGMAERNRKIFAALVKTEDFDAVVRRLDFMLSPVSKRAIIGMYTKAAGFSQRKLEQPVSLIRFIEETGTNSIVFLHTLLATAQKFTPLASDRRYPFIVYAPEAFQDFQLKTEEGEEFVVRSIDLALYHAFSGFGAAPSIRPMNALGFFAYILVNNIFTVSILLLGSLIHFGAGEYFMPGSLLFRVPVYFLLGGSISFFAWLAVRAFTTVLHIAGSFDWDKVLGISEREAGSRAVAALAQVKLTADRKNDYLIQYGLMLIHQLQPIRMVLNELYSEVVNGGKRFEFEDSDHVARQILVAPSFTISAQLLRYLMVRRGGIGVAYDQKLSDESLRLYQRTQSDAKAYSVEWAPLEAAKTEFWKIYGDYELFKKSIRYRYPLLVPYIVLHSMLFSSVAIAETVGFFTSKLFRRSANQFLPGFLRLARWFVWEPLPKKETSEPVPEFSEALAPAVGFGAGHATTEADKWVRQITKTLDTFNDPLLAWDGYLRWVLQYLVGMIDQKGKAAYFQTFPTASLYIGGLPPAEKLQDAQIEKIGDSLRIYWKRRGWENKIGGLNAYMALLGEYDLNTPLKTFRSIEHRINLLIKGNLEEQLLGYWVKGVDLVLHIRHFSPHIERSGILPVDNELLVAVARQFIPLLLAMPKKFEDKTPPVASGYQGDMLGLTHRDLMLWGLSIMLDPSVHDFDHGLIFDVDRHTSKLGREIWPGGPRESIPYYLLRMLTDLDRVDGKGRKTGKKISKEEIENLLAEMLVKNQDRHFWKKKGMRSPWGIASPGLLSNGILGDSAPMPFHTILNSRQRALRDPAFMLALTPGALNRETRKYLRERMYFEDMPVRRQTFLNNPDLMANFQRTIFMRSKAFRRAFPGLKNQVSAFQSQSAMGFGADKSDSELLKELRFEMYDDKGRIKYAKDFKSLNLEFDFRIVPHGVTDTNAKNLFQGGASDGPENELNAEGKEQAQGGAVMLWNEIGADLLIRRDIIFLKTPLKRTKQTADYFVKYAKERGVRIELEDEPAAIEMYLDKWNTPADADAYMNFNALVQPASGESYLRFLKRVREFVEYMNRKYKGKTVVLYGHRTFATALKVLLEDQESKLTQPFIRWRDIVPNSERGKPIHFPSSGFGAEQTQKIDRAVDYLRGQFSILGGNFVSATQWNVEGNMLAIGTKKLTFEEGDSGLEYAPPRVYLFKFTGTDNEQIEFIAEFGPNIRQAHHDGTIMQLIFSSDGKLLASLDKSGTVIVWHLRQSKHTSGQFVYVPSLHEKFPPVDRIEFEEGQGGIQITGRSENKLIFRRQVEGGSKAAFSNTVKVLGRILKNRKRILERIAPKEATREALTRFRDMLKGHYGAKNVFLPLFVASENDGYRTGQFSMGVIRLLDYYIESPSRFRSIKETIPILYDAYVFQLIMLLSLRIWDEGNPDDNIQTIQSLLDELQAGPGNSGKQFVRHAPDLLTLATSLNNYADIGIYRDLIDKTKRFKVKEHRLRFSLANAKGTGSHLRSVIATLYLAPPLEINKETWKAFFAKEEGKIHRTQNEIDYEIIVSALNNLFSRYEELLSGKVNNEERFEIAEAILDGLSADPEYFIDSPEMLRKFVHPSAQPAVDEFKTYLRKNVGSLLKDLKGFDPKRYQYSPLGQVQVVSLPFYNLYEDVLLSLMSGEFQKLSYEDRFTASSFLEIDRQKRAWVRFSDEKLRALDPNFYTMPAFRGRYSYDLASLVYHLTIAGLEKLNRAGFGARTEGSDLLNNPEVIAQMKKAEAPLKRAIDRLSAKTYAAGDSHQVRHSGFVEIAELARIGYRMSVYSNKSARDITPLHKAAYVTDFMSEIMLGEGVKDYTLLKRGIAAAVFQDIGIVRGMKWKLRKADLDAKIKKEAAEIDASAPNRDKKLRDIITTNVRKAIDSRRAHMVSGKEIARQTMELYNEWRPDFFSEEDMEEISRLIETHDNPSLQAFELLRQEYLQQYGVPFRQKTKSWLFKPDDKLAMYLREADRLWMLTEDGVDVDFKQDLKRGIVKSPKETAARNVRRHREEMELYGKILGTGAEQYGFKNGLLFRTKTGYTIFERLAQTLIEKYHPTGEKALSEELAKLPEGFPRVPKEQVGFGIEKTLARSSQKLGERVIAELIERDIVGALGPLTDRAEFGAEVLHRAGISTDDLHGLIEAEKARILERIEALDLNTLIISGDQFETWKEETSVLLQSMNHPELRPYIISKFSQVLGLFGDALPADSKKMADELRTLLRIPDHRAVVVSDYSANLERLHLKKAIPLKLDVTRILLVGEMPPNLEIALGANAYSVAAAELNSLLDRFMQLESIAESFAVAA